MSMDPERRRLLESLLERKGIRTPGSNGGPGPAPAAAGAREAPASFAQARMWFLSRMDPGSPVYNVSASVRLNGRLDVGALSAALTRIVQRHEALRTTFAERGGEPVQVVGEPLGVEVPVVDVRPDEAMAEAGRIAAAPFDLGAGPLLRAVLLRTGEQEHVLLLAVHHIVCDGWSVGVLLSELSELYGAAVRSRVADLPALPVQYTDYARWQREQQSVALDESLLFWTRTLRGTPPVLDLPADRPRPQMQCTSGASVDVEIDPPLARRLDELARSSGATAFMVLLAAWTTLLHRYTGRTDIVVGCPVAGRERPELEPLVGLFVNTLPVRVDLSGEPSFADLVARVRTSVLEALAHQSLPFERLVEELRPPREIATTPVFQVAFALQNAPAGDLSLEGLEVSFEQVQETTAKFDLSLDLTPLEGGIYGSL
ncbi:MAG TPA: condensation domain-containing protein, partial [Actinomycetota bacterium]|nr:condensation domain-containing protein [Actinomycetota bacterium]